MNNLCVYQDGLSRCGGIDENDRLQCKFFSPSGKKCLNYRDDIVDVHCDNRYAQHEARNTQTQF